MSPPPPSSSTDSTSPPTLQRLIVLPLRVRLPSHRASWLRHRQWQAARAGRDGSNSSSALHAPPPRLDLQGLPELVHDTIAPFLTMSDMNHLLEVDHQLQEAYGCRIKAVRLHCGDLGRVKISSLLRRRPGLQHATFLDYNYNTIGEIIRAMRSKACEHLRTLTMGRCDVEGKPPNLPGFFQVLGEGCCPRLHGLDLQLAWDVRPAIRALGEGLRLRTRRSGVCGLKALAIRPIESDVELSIANLSAILSSGACESLEELRLERCILEEASSHALGEWLRRSGARLRVFSFDLNSEAAAAFCAQGVAPCLQSLETRTVDSHALELLMGALWWGKWRDCLQELRLVTLPYALLDEDGDGDDGESMSRLVEAVGLGAPRLKVLGLSGPLVGSDEGAIILARALREGVAFPLVEELDLRDAGLGDSGVIELAWAVDEDSPRSSQLRRLDLSRNDLNPEGMLELAEALVGGAYRNLEYLNLGENWDLGNEGVCYLAHALEAGALPVLKELVLERVGLSDGGVKLLADALAVDRACPHLVRLDLRGNYGITSTTKKALVAALNSKPGPAKVHVEHGGKCGRPVGHPLAAIYHDDDEEGYDFEIPSWEEAHLQHRYYLHPLGDDYGPMPLGHYLSSPPHNNHNYQPPQQQQRHHQAPPPYQHHRHQPPHHGGGKGVGRRR